MFLCFDRVRKNSTESFLRTDSFSGKSAFSGRVPFYSPMKVAGRFAFLSSVTSNFLFLTILLFTSPAVSIRFPDRSLESPADPFNRPLKTAVFALGSFWRSEAVFGCLDGVVRTTAGYSGGSKSNPEYRNLGDHAECVQVTFILFKFEDLILCFHA